MSFPYRQCSAFGIALLSLFLTTAVQAQTTYQIDFKPGTDNISAIAFATGKDLNNDGTITGDTGPFYNIYNGLPNEWTNVAISFFQNGSRLGTYHPVVDGISSYNYFLLGVNATVPTLENADIGKEPDFYAINVPSQGYDPKGEWYNDVANTSGLFGGTEIMVAPAATVQHYQIDFLPGEDGISATAFATGIDLNRDGSITGDANHYHFYNDYPNEWSDVSITFSRNGTTLGTYHPVQNGVIAYDYFVLGMDTFSSALENADLGMDPNYYAINVPSQGYNPNGEWFNDLEDASGIFGGTQVTNLNSSVAPEPSAVSLLLLCFAGLFAARKVMKAGQSRA